MVVSSKAPLSLIEPYHFAAAEMRAADVPGRRNMRERRRSWADLTAWQIDRDGASPLFRQVYGQIRSAILAQILRPGTKLPSTRELASLLSVSRSAVVSAYEQLFAEGYVCGKIGSGTYVFSDLPDRDDGPRRRGTAVGPGRRPSQGRSIADLID